MRLISTDSPFERRIGYSRAVVDGEMVYVSGTTGYDYQTMNMPADAESQARNALASVAAALGEAGVAMRDVVRVRYYLTDRADYDAVVGVVGKAFGEIRPAATMIVCGLTMPEMKIEIEVTARRGAHASGAYSGSY